jgi:hypothetical protein
MRRSTAPRYAVTSALLECAVALAIVGRETEARSCAAESLALAKQYGFHEIEIRAEALLQQKEKHERSGGPARLKPRTVSVVRRISSLEPARLPKHVRPAAVTS